MIESNYQILVIQNLLAEDDLLWDDDFKNTSSILEAVSENTKENDHAVRLAAKLYHFPDLSGKRINTVIHDFAQLFEDSLSSIKSEVHKRLKSSGIEEKCISEIESVVDNLTKPFQNMETESQRFSKFRKCDTFIVPESYKIGERTEFKSTPTGVTRKEVSVVAQFIPIRHVLKKFFEMPGIFAKTMEYVNLLNSNSHIISNIIQCSHWKEKIAGHDKEKIVLPLMMFFDDYENNNPLGSHKGISKSVYLTVPCLPEDFQSKIENIFLFIIFNTLDRKRYTNSIVFEKVIQEFKFLQDEGIILNLTDGKKTIYFDLALIAGDNLCLHSIFGFLESFRAKKFCRFCLIHSKDINTIFREIDCKLRNMENYNSSLASKNPQETGIQQTCCFNRIARFHIIYNPAVDIMHDFLEGVCRYDLALILHYFIYVREYFTHANLNTKIRAFYYGPNKGVNKPAEILEKHLTQKYKCIIMSSAEMLNLIRNLSLIIGSDIDTTDEHWQLVLSLQEILEILCNTKISADTPKTLESKIFEYLSLLTKKFPSSMKPKHHFLIHYPSIMQKVGPLWNICCLRFESKHREAKQTSHAAICRINVCRTIAIRHQLTLNYRLLNQNSSHAAYECISQIKNVPLKDLPDITDFLQLLPSHFIDKKVSVTKSIQFKGKSIKEGCVIITFSELGEAFHLVHLIILINEKDFLVVVKSITDCYLNEHFRAFKIHSTCSFQWEILDRNDLNNAEFSYVNQLKDGFFYVTKTWM